jgi:hypothetical protein
VRWIGRLMLHLRSRCWEKAWICRDLGFLPGFGDFFHFLGPFLIRRIPKAASLEIIYKKRTNWRSYCIPRSSYEFFFFSM